ncbi:MAG TPA: hypothetical protein VFH54_13000 [Mycobacteriales bacterium]|nr:hypothetical protein [Mycobacteriales bacterium]
MEPDHDVERMGYQDMLNLDERVGSAVGSYLREDPKRLSASRLLTLAFAGLFALATLVCLLDGEWGFAAVYGLITAGIWLFVRRFLTR